MKQFSLSSKLLAHKYNITRLRRRRVLNRKASRRRGAQKFCVTGRQTPLSTSDQTFALQAPRWADPRNIFFFS